LFAHVTAAAAAAMRAHIKSRARARARKYPGRRRRLLARPHFTGGRLFSFFFPPNTHCVLRKVCVCFYIAIPRERGGGNKKIDI
jgi:hypothetical protein